jgi:hypothetical protein
MEDKHQNYIFQTHFQPIILGLPLRRFIGNEVLKEY